MFMPAMRLCLIFGLFAVFSAICNADREKRFLNPRNWAFLPERLLRLPDNGFSVSRLDGPFPSLLRPSPLESIFRIPNREALRPNETPKKAQATNIHREMEDPVEEGESKVNAEEVFVDPPSRPEPESEKNPADKEIPIFVKSFNFNPLAFNFDFFTPWWKGENVCVERNEIDETDPDMADGSGFMINFEATQCSPTESSYTCTKKVRRNGMKKTITVKHQCCHGFDRKSDGKPGCKEVAMDDTMETMKSLDANRFADMIGQTLSIKEKVLSENFTVFAPINEAMVDYEEESEDNEIMNASPKKDFSYLIGGHIVDGLINLGSVKDDTLLESINGKTTIRINKYRPMMQTITTANCVPVSSKNNMAKNGIIHVVSSILPMPRKSLADVITATPKLSVFSKLLSSNDEVMAELEDQEKSWTLFIPTDKAFQNMNSEMLQRLLTGEGCYESVLRNHIVKGTFCSSSIAGQFRIRNSLGKPLTVSQDEVARFSVDGVKISKTDIVATNGVIHFIEEVMIPSEAKGILEALEERKDIMDLIKLAELESTFENLSNVTFFVPSKDAIKAISNETMQKWTEDPQKLQEILLYHMVSPRLTISEFKHNQELASLAEDRNVRLQLHEMFPGIAMGASAQCSLVIGHDHEVCGGVIHYLDKMIKPPKGSIMEVLKSMDERNEGQTHKILIKMLESTDLETKLQNESEGPFTLIAPTDKAFEKIEKDSLEELMENKTKAEQILRMHVLPETLCCSAISPISFPFRQHYVRTLEGNLLAVHRRYLSEGVRFGPARALECDVTARNGLIHSVNRVILPNRRPVPSIFDFDGFGMMFK